MKYINILSSKLNSPNGIAFLFPLVKFKKNLLDSGFNINFYTNVKNNSLFDCNFLIIDYRYLYGDFQKNLQKLVQVLDGKKKNIDKVFFFDNSDSTGTLSNDIFEFVDVYLKNQILRDLSKYQEKFYGARIYTDFYFKNFKIIDNTPFYQTPVKKDNLKKIKVGWNSGLCEYSIFSAYKQNLIKNFYNINLLKFLKFSKKVTSPLVKRTNSFSCRVGEDYSRNTISFQRKEINKRIKRYKKINKISRQKYFQELSNTKVVVSPFGWGEISLRDFEVFLCGGLLFKPKMDHLKTWPNFFEEDKTLKCFDWSLSNFDLSLEEILDNYQKYISISLMGQRRYLKYTSGDNAFELFLKHLKSILI